MSEKVINLSPDKNIPRGKRFSQNNRKIGMGIGLGCFIKVSIFFVDLPPASDRVNVIFTKLLQKLTKSQHDELPFTNDVEDSVSWEYVRVKLGGPALSYAPLPQVFFFLRYKVSM